MANVKTGIKNSVNRDVVMEEIVGELRHLRLLVREVGDCYVFRKEAEIEAVISYLETLPTALLKRELPGWLGDIRGMKIKPAKGRLKDIKNIDELIVNLADRVVCAQEWKAGKGKE